MLADNETSEGLAIGGLYTLTVHGGLGDVTLDGAAGASVYVGSRRAVECITKSAALEVAPSGVRVNAVAPGPTDTGMLDRFTGNPQNKAALVSTVPLGRMGTPDEIFRPIVFVASASASFVTGQVVSVDGGKAVG